MKVEFKKWDAADYLEDPELAQAYLDVALESHDPEKVVRAIGDIARAKGMAEVAKKMSVNRESLYKSLFGKSEPKFSTIFKALEALGLNFTINIRPRRKSATA